MEKRGDKETGVVSLRLSACPGENGDRLVFPCQRSDLRRLLLALDEGEANDS